MYRVSDMARQMTTKNYGTCAAVLCMIHTLAPYAQWDSSEFSGTLHNPTQPYVLETRGTL
jgi:hypothetical protein